MADAKLSKLYLSSKQFKKATEQSQDRPKDLRLGQWLVNQFGEKGVAYPHIFYLDDPTEVWANVEVIEDTPKGE